MCSDCAAVDSVNKALVAAAEAGHNVCVDALVKAGADVTARKYLWSTQQVEVIADVLRSLLQQELM